MVRWLRPAPSKAVIAAAPACLPGISVLVCWCRHGLLGAAVEQTGFGRGGTDRLAIGGGSSRWLADYVIAGVVLSLLWNCAASRRPGGLWVEEPTVVTPSLALLHGGAVQLQVRVRVAGRWVSGQCRYIHATLSRFRAVLHARGVLAKAAAPAAPVGAAAWVPPRLMSMAPISDSPNWGL